MSVLDLDAIEADRGEAESRWAFSPTAALKLATVHVPALVARVRELEAAEQRECDEVNRVLALNRELHRRAQRLEGVEARLARLRAGYERFIAYLYRDAWLQRRGAHKRFCLVYDALGAAGWPWGTKRPAEKIPGMDRRRNADAVELVGMLAAERDQERARAEAAEAEVARLRAAVEDARGALEQIERGDVGRLSEAVEMAVLALEHLRALDGGEAAP